MILSGNQCRSRSDSTDVQADLDLHWSEHIKHISRQAEGMMDEKDQHFCIVCRQTVWGLENYVRHRKQSCGQESETNILDEGSNSNQNNADRSLNADSSITKEKTNTLAQSSCENEQIEKAFELCGVPFENVTLKDVISTSNEEQNNELKIPRVVGVVKSVSMDESTVADEDNFIEEWDGDSEDDMDTSENSSSDVKKETLSDVGSSTKSSEHGILSARKTRVVNNEGLRKKYKHFSVETGLYECTVCKKSFKLETYFSQHCKSKRHELKLRKQRKAKRRIKKEAVLTAPSKVCDVNLDKLVKTEMKEEVSDEKQIEDKIYVCTVCDKKYTNKLMLAKHLVSDSHKSASEAEGTEKEQLEMVMKCQTEIIHLSPFCCKICDFYCNTSYDFDNHMKSTFHCETVSNSESNVFECSLCEVQAIGQENLLKHLESDSHNMALKNGTKALLISIVRKNKRKTTFRYECKICNVKFTNKTSFKHHLASKDHASKTLETGNEHKMQESEQKDCEIKVEVSKSNLENEFDADVGKVAVKTKVDLVPENKNFDENQTNDDSNGGEDFDQNPIDLFDGFQKKSNSGVCKYCTYYAKTFNDLRMHYMKVHQEMIKVCEPCNLIFPHGKGYQRHVLSKEHQKNIVKDGEKCSESLFECHVCMKRFADENYCKFHTAYYHFHAKTEEEVFNSQSITRQRYADFLVTLEKAKNMESLPCPEVGCDAKVLKTNMLGHLRKHTNEKPFKCNICVDGFLNASSLRRHLLQHFGCEERTCEICGKHLNSMSNYNQHMRMHKAMRSQSKSFVCFICGESFYINRQLKAHQKNHNEKIHKCTVPGCNWAFKTPHDVKRHLVTHTESKHYVCTTCGYATKSMKYLLAHEKIHSETEQTLIHCQYCDYKTARKYHMTRHTRIHIGAKPFKCPYCVYSCNTHANLRKHILETNYHKGLNMYPCKFCKFSTNCTKEFRVHLMDNHKEVSNNMDRSFAAFVGLFNKDEDVEAQIEGANILPLRGKTSSRRKYKQPETDETPENKSLPLKYRYTTEENTSTPLKYRYTTGDNTSPPLKYTTEDQKTPPHKIRYTTEDNDTMITSVRIEKISSHGSLLIVTGDDMDDTDEERL